MKSVFDQAVQSIDRGAQAEEILRHVDEDLLKRQIRLLRDIRNSIEYLKKHPRQYHLLEADECDILSNGLIPLLEEILLWRLKFIPEEEE